MDEIARVRSACGSSPVTAVAVDREGSSAGGLGGSVRCSPLQFQQPSEPPKDVDSGSFSLSRLKGKTGTCYRKVCSLDFRTRLLS